MTADHEDPASTPDQQSFEDSSSQIYRDAVRDHGGVTNYTIPASGSNVRVVASGSGSIAVGGDISGSISLSRQSELTDEEDKYLVGIEKELRNRTTHAKMRLRAYRLLRFVMLSASAVTPALALLRAEPLVTASVGTVAFLTEGAIQLTRLQDRALLDIHRASKIGREYRMYRLAVGDYRAANKLALLAERIEEIRADSDVSELRLLQQTFTENAPQGQNK